ncbi:uncharacterized protein PITG_07941 [Phytophthora infestans T30-4]|uniref:Uncharacterized protein n=1 Tax=Phytophthora infestans (strain T30-4) TaxID=403677 RepID=D0N937_PHYIT|nr:uncharacterized protein PITG_07941 [Phytophthora infestans T30-4]EEY54325.1 conserved hypothetical protein [Phytophthora infestans T30-4]|eukprot:XP_002904147.1 conserved hypothetical protein [Phytophthora infestans T30-4]
MASQRLYAFWESTDTKVHMNTLSNELPLKATLIASTR